MPTVQFVQHLNVPFPLADVYKLVDDIETEGLTAFGVLRYIMPSLPTISLCHSCINNQTAGDSMCQSCSVGLHPCSLHAKALPIVESSFCACSRLIKLMDLQEKDDFGLRISSMELLSVMTEFIQFT